MSTPQISSLSTNIATWAENNNSTLEDFTRQAINHFYPRVMDDDRLAHFFQGANIDALERHQTAFMGNLFSGKEAGGFTSAELFRIHKNLIKNRGLKDVHVDYFLEVFTDTLREMNVDQALITEIHDHLVPFRKAFSEATSLYTQGREQRLFFALDDDADGALPEQTLRDALGSSGLHEIDERLEVLFKSLDANGGADLDSTQFCKILGSAGLLVEQALQGHLAIPDFDKFTAQIDQIFETVEENRSGHQADYIPPLAKANPEKFGVAVVSVDGQVYTRGDANIDFSIQSMCKPLNYCFALEELGPDEVHRHVGNEPSGRAFNNRDLMARLFDNRAKGSAEEIEVPFNPMINAGAIMTAALVKSDAPYKQRLRHIREQWGRLIGRIVDSESKVRLPRFNKEMARQENYTGFNNFALAYLLMATGLLPHNPSSIPGDTCPDDPDDYDFIYEKAVSDALKVYFSTCALELTAKEVATMAATLANGGVCPTTQERVLQQSTVRSCLSVTQTCGMYDGSGDFFYNIGLPAKSGVGGGVFLVIPKLMGICIFSPRLDVQGNSARGVDMAKRLLNQFKLHAYDGVMTDGARIDPSVPVARWRATQCSEALWAASKGDLKTLERLHSEQYDLSTGDYDLRTPMHLAAAEGHRHVVQFLIEHGIEPIADRWGGTPSADAITNGHADIVHLLANSGFSEEAQKHLVQEPEGPTNNAATFGDDTLVVELLWAASENDLSGLRRLVSQGVPVHAMDYDKRTALHLAAAEGQLKAVEYLVAHGHPLFVRDRWGATPLDEATREEREDVVVLLQDRATQFGKAPN